ncbi:MULTISPECIES: hypothetical protein [unclassified Bartonella]
MLRAVCQHPRAGKVGGGLALRRGMIAKKSRGIISGKIIFCFDECGGNS